MGSIHLRGGACSPFQVSAFWMAEIDVMEWRETCGSYGTTCNTPSKYKAPLYSIEIASRSAKELA